MAALGPYVTIFSVLDGVVRIERLLNGAHNLGIAMGQTSRDSFSTSTLLIGSCPTT
jgi:hypothetical protein